MLHLPATAGVSVLHLQQLVLEWCAAQLHSMFSSASPDMDQVLEGRQHAHCTGHIMRVMGYGRSCRLWGMAGHAGIHVQSPSAHPSIHNVRQHVHLSSFNLCRNIYLKSISVVFFWDSISNLVLYSPKMTYQIRRRKFTALCTHFVNKKYKGSVCFPTSVFQRFPWDTSRNFFARSARTMSSISIRAQMPSTGWSLKVAIHRYPIA